MRLFLTNLVAVFAVLMAPLMAFGDTDAQRDQKLRLQLSIRQATLVQAMSSDACFAMAGVDADLSGQRALEHLDMFSTVLDGLRDGHEWLGLLPETRPDLRRELAQAHLVWDRYRPVIQQIIAKDYHSVVMAQMLTTNVFTVEASDALAQAFIGAVGRDVFDARATATMIYAGHHRMLTQRALLELCYVMADLGGDDMGAQLLRTLDEIDTGFTVLAEGNDTVTAPPNTRIGRNFRTAALFWSKMRPALVEVGRGAKVEEAAIKKVLKFNESVLKQLNQALEGYVAARL